MPSRFEGRGGSDEGCVFVTVEGEKPSVRVESLSPFWLCPSRNRNTTVGATYELRRVRAGWTFAAPHMPWWCFNDDGTMDSH